MYEPKMACYERKMKTPFAQLIGQIPGGILRTTTNSLLLLNGGSARRKVISSNPLQLLGPTTDGPRYQPASLSKYSLLGVF